MQTIDVRLRNIIKNRQLTFTNNPPGSALVNTVTALHSRCNYKMKPISIRPRLHETGTKSNRDDFVSTFEFTGYISWDDEDTRNANKHSGVLPDGSYGINTKIYFCCRDDRLISQVNILVGLPKCSQMILMRYKGTCPRMLFGYRGHHTGFLQWDTEDSQNADRRVGVYPDGQKTFGSGIKIEFCSFTSDYSC